MTLCPECGNKRCPGAVDHTLPCSHSNDSEENAKAWARIRENGYRGASPGFVETTPEGVKLVHWFDNDGNEHINGMGVWPE
jgi:hypothetical protein